VQITMIGWTVMGGVKPRVREWAGLGMAFSGLVALTSRGLEAPDFTGALLMALAGIGWGIYSLRGRGSQSPLAATADNFLRTLPLAALLSLLTLSSFHASPAGIVLAFLSGGFASGLGYSLWYGVLPRLTAARAAIIQLLVPLLAALGGVLLLGEAVTTRLVLAGLLILAGVGIAVLRGKKD
jgi:drug/metabolite transporter (DMT)-like permease